MEYYPEPLSPLQIEFLKTPPHLAPPTVTGGLSELFFRPPGSPRSHEYLATDLEIITISQSRHRKRHLQASDEHNRAHDAFEGSACAKVEDAMARLRVADSQPAYAHGPSHYSPMGTYTHAHLVQEPIHEPPSVPPPASAGRYRSEISYNSPKSRSHVEPAKRNSVSRTTRSSRASSLSQDSPHCPPPDRQPYRRQTQMPAVSVQGW